MYWYTHEKSWEKLDHLRFGELNQPFIRQMNHVIVIWHNGELARDPWIQENANLTAIYAVSHTNNSEVFKTFDEKNAGG